MDPIQNTTSASKSQRQLTTTLRIAICFGALLVIYSIYFLQAGMVQSLWYFVPAILAVLAAIWFTTRKRQLLASTLLMAAIAALAIITPLFQSGLQPPYAIGALALIGMIGLATLPRRSVGYSLLLGTSVAILSLLVELFGPAGRVQAASSTLRWTLSLVLLVLLILYFSREFISLNIRTKIVLGILATGGVALGIFAVFSSVQTQQVTRILSGRLETSVSDLAEEQLTNQVNTLAAQADQSFNDVRQNVEGLAQNWVSLQDQKYKLSSGYYWDARNKLTQINDGRYGNPTTDVSSVYVPANLTLEGNLVAEINTSAYLDFYAPELLESNPALLAVYAIDAHGVVRYYPNINLAAVLPEGFDARERPYYEITSPLFNPQRSTRWTIPYLDATGGGLVVTVASPVYQGNTFRGIVAADMQLSKITQQVQGLKTGQSGYAFMIDDAGRILSMPDAGYELFGLSPDDVKQDDFFKQTIFGIGPDQVQAVVRRMAAGGNGLVIMDNNGVDTYIAYSPIQTNGYSLALVVPVAELQTTIVAARHETQAQVQSGVRLLALILIALLVGAIVISIGIGQVISAPIVKLTGITKQIVSGDFTARANINSEDEIGTLSNAFDTMTGRLQESLQELENRVAQRTAELATANEKNERRARQFEAISQIASTISSTRDLNALLPQITTSISNRLGFYHAGIFLLDARKEYAVLGAANSEGGQKMLANNHRLRVGETGIVGYVASTGRPRVALNTGHDAVFFNNRWLPDTRSEIAVPLKVGEEIMGVLDVQSTVENAFGQEDINILTALADQVSIAIQNARQYEETRKALAESMATSRQFVQTGWQQFTKSQEIAGIHHTGAKATILYANRNGDTEDSTPARERAKANHRGVSLSLPVKLRGEVIGSVDVHSMDSRKWDQDELDIVSAIIERAAIALENARLLAESQKRATKERTIGDISAKISAQSNIDQLLKIAAQELSRTLPGANIAIQFHSSTETE